MYVQLMISLRTKFDTSSSNVRQIWPLHRKLKTIFARPPFYYFTKINKSLHVCNSY